MSSRQSCFQQTTWLPVFWKEHDHKGHLKVLLLEEVSFQVSLLNPCPFHQVAVVVRRLLKLCKRSDMGWEHTFVYNLVRHTSFSSIVKIVLQQDHGRIQVHTKEKPVLNLIRLLERFTYTRVYTWSSSNLILSNTFQQILIEPSKSLT